MNFEAFSRDCPKRYFSRDCPKRYFSRDCPKRYLRNVQSQYLLKFLIILQPTNSVIIKQIKLF